MINDVSVTEEENKSEIDHKSLHKQNTLSIRIDDEDKEKLEKLLKTDGTESMDNTYQEIEDEEMSHDRKNSLELALEGENLENFNKEVLNELISPIMSDNKNYQHIKSNSVNEVNTPNSVKEEQFEETKNIKEILSPMHFAVGKSPEFDWSKSVIDSEKGSFITVEVDSGLKSGEQDHLFDFSSISYKEFIQQIIKNQEFIEKYLKITKSADIVLKHFLKRCQIKYPEDFFELFTEEQQLLIDHPINLRININLLNKTHEKALISFEIFTEACKNTYKALRYPNNLRSTLKNSLKEYTQLKLTSNNIQETDFLQSMINKLKKQIKKLSQTPKNVQKKNIFEENAENGINDIFKFYSKQHLLLEKSPTFEVINKNLEVLTLSKFLIFCKDFELIKSTTNPKKISTNMQAIHDIFKRNSNCLKDMNKTQFFQAITEISDFYLNNEFDLDHNTEFSSLNANEKKLK